MKTIASIAAAAMFAIAPAVAQEAAAPAATAASNSGASAAAISAIALASVEAASSRTQDDLKIQNLRRIDTDIAARAAMLEAKIEAPRF